MIVSAMAEGAEGWEAAEAATEAAATPYIPSYFRQHVGWADEQRQQDYNRSHRFRVMVDNRRDKGTLVGLAGTPEERVLPSGEVVAVAVIPRTLQFAEDREIWERQPGETNIAWKAFEAYRAASPHNRTYIHTARTLHKLIDGTYIAAKSTAGWAARFRWDERIQAFDNYIAQQELDMLIKERVRARKETAELGRGLRIKAQEALSALTTVLYRNVTDPETGKISRELRSSLTPSEIARLAATGAKIERLALDIEHSNMDGTPRETIDLQSLTVNYFSSGAAAEERALEEARAILKLQEAQAETVSRVNESSPGGVRAEDVIEGEIDEE